MKRHILFLLAVSLITISARAQTFGGGDGSEQSPYIISAPEHLVQLSNMVNGAKCPTGKAVYSFKCDLDMAGIEFTPIAEGGSVVFHGTIRGNGHKIHNLYIARPDVENVGLVGNMGDGEISDLTIASGSISGKQCVGAFAGRTRGTLTNVVNHATVKAEVDNCGGIAGRVDSAVEIHQARNHGNVGGNMNVGGIVGKTEVDTDVHLLIKHCLNNGDITASVANAGGIIGSSIVAEIEGCANTGAITCTADYVKDIYAGAGGLVGLGVPWVRNSLNTGVVTGADHTGGLLGKPVNDTTVFYLSNSVSNGYVQAPEKAASVGAIAGGLTRKAHFSEVAYDAQMDTLPGVMRKDVDGVKGLPTAELTRFIPNRQWHPGFGVYPIPYSLSDDSTLLAASQPVILAAGDTRHRVTQAFFVTTLEGYEWSMPKPFYQVDDKVYLRRGLKTTTQIRVTDHRGHQRIYWLTIDYTDTGGDLDGNGIIDVSDLNTMLNIVIGAEPDYFDYYRADVNRDGKVDISDINLTIGYLLEAE